MQREVRDDLGRSTAVDWFGSVDHHRTEHPDFDVDVGATGRCRQDRGNVDSGGGCVRRGGGVGLVGEEQLLGVADRSVRQEVIDRIQVLRREGQRLQVEPVRIEVCCRTQGERPARREGFSDQQCGDSTTTGHGLDQSLPVSIGQGFHADQDRHTPSLFRGMVTPGGRGVSHAQPVERITGAASGMSEPVDRLVDCRHRCDPFAGREVELLADRDEVDQLGHG